MVTVQDVFDYMEIVFNKEESLKNKQDIVITLNIAGSGGGTWQLIIGKGFYKFQPGNEISPVTATINYRDVDSLYKTITGQMSGVRAYASGAIKYEGSAKTLVRMGKVFTTKKEKKKKKKIWKR